jgi:hypothetical protein
LLPIGYDSPGFKTGFKHNKNQPLGADFLDEWDFFGEKDGNGGFPL